MIKNKIRRTEEHKRRISETLKGHKVSKETKEKISKALKGKEIAWNKGLKNYLSKESLEKMRLKKLGIKHSEEHKRKISEGNMGKILTGETIEKIRKKHIENWKNGKERINDNHFKKGHKGYLCRLGCKNSKETIEKIKLKRATQIFPMYDSNIEIKVQNFLKQLNINFYTHQYMRIPHAYQCDILIPSMDLIIECDGDFWHCNPKFYSKNFVRFPNGSDKRTAKMIWERDEIRMKELGAEGFNVLRLWESEIKVMDLNKFKQKLGEIKW